jgi:hypothetical protein
MTTDIAAEQTTRKVATVRRWKSGVWVGWSLVICSPWMNCSAQSQAIAGPAGSRFTVKTAGRLTPQEAKTAVQHIVNWLPDETMARFELYAPTTIAAMFDMLEDPRELQYWPNALLVLASVGTEKTVPVSRLIDFLERPGPMEHGRPASMHNSANREKSIKGPAPYIYPAAVEAKRDVLVALGRLVQNSPVEPKSQSRKSEALDYILQGSDAGFWQNKIQWNSAPHYKSDEARNADFAAAARENYDMACIAEGQKTYARSTNAGHENLPKLCRQTISPHP